jgi:predicted metal-dependent hydrolase
MEVKPAYKQTEVGVIPEDWETRSLRDSTEPQRPISYGIVQTGPHLSNGVACLRVVDINDGRINKSNLIRTSKQISDAYRRTILKSGDLVMPLRGKVGDVGIVDVELEGANLTRGVALLAILPNLNSEFCRHFISWSATRRRLEQSMNGSALQEIPIGALRSFQIAFPKSEPERRTIAGALAAPRRMSLNTVRVFAIAKLPWIKRQQQKLREQERETPREYIDRESHYVWGKRYLLKIIEADQPPSVELSHGRMFLRIRRGTDRAKRQAILDEWCREQVRDAVPPLIEKWARLMDVGVRRFFVQRMKTKWGSCNHRAGSIRLNTDLARKPIECLEYLIVHEMAHLIEPTHNARFIALMDRFMPKWQSVREVLNRLPVRHEDWAY